MQVALLPFPSIKSIMPSIWELKFIIMGTYPPSQVYWAYYMGTQA